MIEVHYMHVWECHNETHYFVQLIYTNKNYDVSWVRWHISVIPALVRLRQEERVRGQLVYIMKPCLKKEKNTIMLLKCYTL
jgi:hypothetical protein